MTEKNPKTQRVERARVDRAALVNLNAESARDPFEDPELDALLEQHVDAKGEARLLIADRLLNRVRFRREV